MRKKVFLSGSFDPLHSGHVALFKKASELGDLYVGMGNDDSVEQYKHKPVFWTAEERLYMVKAIRYVTDASINDGMSLTDFITNPMFLGCDILVVGKDRDCLRLRNLCESLSKEYIVFDRIHAEGLPHRSSTEIRDYDKR